MNTWNTHRQDGVYTFLDTLAHWRSLEWLIRGDLILIGTLLGNAFFIFFNRLYCFRFHRLNRLRCVRPSLRRGFTPIRTGTVASADSTALESQVGAKPLAQKRYRARSHELRLGFASLATIATCAPLLGFLGTLFGIITAFGSTAMAKYAEFQMIASGVAEALVTTALGLLVAVFASWCRSCLSYRLEALETCFPTLKREVTPPLTSDTVFCEIAYDRQGVVLLGVWGYMLYVVWVFAS